VKIAAHDRAYSRGVGRAWGQLGQLAELGDVQVGGHGTENLHRLVARVLKVWAVPGGPSPECRRGRRPARRELLVLHDASTRLLRR
jgi:hypothetical protein